MEKKYFFGLTLIELVIVVALIMMLAFLIISFLTGQTFKGNDAKRKADINRIGVAAEEYEKDHNCYPDTIICGVHSDQEVYPYLNDVPCDPVTHASYLYVPDGSTLCPSWFKLYTLLENTKDISATPGIGPHSAFNYVAGSDSIYATGFVPPAPGSTSGPTPTPGPPPPEQDNFYGCRNLVCVPIVWNPARPGPECDPNYQNSSCYGMCSDPQYECLEWH